MKKRYNYILLAFLMVALFSCTVTNNMYLNNPIPKGKGNGEISFGAGTGLQPSIDSVSLNGTVNFSNRISTAPILSIHGQFGITKKIDLRGAIHFPKILGGLGGRVGGQYSFMEEQSRFNAAIGSDLGFVATRDSFRIFGSASPTKDRETNGAINADFFFPVSVKLGGLVKVILTPRYSFNAIYIRKNYYHRSSKTFKPNYTALTLGVRANKFYIETTALYYQKTIYPHVGIAWLLVFDPGK